MYKICKPVVWLYPCIFILHFSRYLHKLYRLLLTFLSNLEQKISYILLGSSLCVSSFLYIEYVTSIMSMQDVYVLRFIYDLLSNHYIFNCLLFSTSISLSNYIHKVSNLLLLQTFNLIFK